MSQFVATQLERSSEPSHLANAPRFWLSPHFKLLESAPRAQRARRQKMRGNLSLTQRSCARYVHRKKEPIDVREICIEISSAKDCSTSTVTNELGSRAAAAL